MSVSVVMTFPCYVCCYIAGVSGRVHSAFAHDGKYVSTFTSCSVLLLLMYIYMQYTMELEPLLKDAPNKLKGTIEITSTFLNMAPKVSFPIVLIPPKRGLGLSIYNGQNGSSQRVLCSKGPL